MLMTFAGDVNPSMRAIPDAEPDRFPGPDASLRASVLLQSWNRIPALWMHRIGR
jgi:hypothetical protein